MRQPVVMTQKKTLGRAVVLLELYQTHCRPPDQPASGVAPLRCSLSKPNYRKRAHGSHGISGRAGGKHSHGFLDTQFARYCCANSLRGCVQRYEDCELHVRITSIKKPTRTWGLQIRSGVTKQDGWRGGRVEDSSMDCNEGSTDRYIDKKLS